jgi:hypothetical protein
VCQHHEAPHAEIHPPESATARNAPPWSNPACEATFAGCATATPKAHSLPLTTAFRTR